jgi:tRNASer (uridine44-2'-O)-methyltransferase
MHATYKPPQHPHSPEGNFEAGLEQGQSRYKSYLMWLGWVGLNCGWEWETEPLRIPSTRGWGIVGTSSFYRSVFGSTDE